MKNKFLSICLGVSAVILAVAFLLRSVPSAQAAPRPEAFLDEGTNKIGKYMMTLSTANDPDRVYHFVLVWDTETGKSKYYSYSWSAGKWVDFGEDIPSSPLGE